MKKILNNLTKTITASLLLMIMSIGFTSCEASKEFSDSASKLNKRNHSITFDEFKNETNQHDFKTKIKIRSNTTNSLARNADGSYELSDFDIDTDIIKRLELNDKTTYSFRIFPTVLISPKSIYNLVLQKKDSQWTQSVLEFKPTEENYEEVISGITEKFEGKANLLYVSNADEIISNGACHKVEIVSTHCNGLGSCTNEFCDGCLGSEGVGCVEKQYASFCLNNNSLTLGNETDILNQTGAETSGNPEDYSLIPNINDMRKQSLDFVEKNINLSNQIIELLNRESNLNFSNFPQDINNIEQLRTAFVNSGVTKIDDLLNLLTIRNETATEFINNNKDFNSLKQITKDRIINDAFNSIYVSDNNEASRSRSCYQQWLVQAGRCNRNFAIAGTGAVIAAGLTGGVGGLIGGGIACSVLWFCKSDALDDYNDCMDN